MEERQISPPLIEQDRPRSGALSAEIATGGRHSGSGEITKSP